MHSIEDAFNMVSLMPRLIFVHLVFIKKERVADVQRVLIIDSETSLILT